MTEKALENNFTAWCREREIVPIKGPVTTTKVFLIDSCNYQTVAELSM